MKSIHALLGALALIVAASVAAPEVDAGVGVQSSCSQPKVATSTATSTATTTVTQAVPQTTVTTYDLPATYVETPAREVTVTIPGERVQVAPARTVSVQSSSVATQSVQTAVATDCVQTQSVPTAVDTTVWKKARLKTLLANRHKDEQQLTTQTVTTVETQTECKRKRLRDRRATQIDGIELDP